MKLRSMKTYTDTEVTRVTTTTRGHSPATATTSQIAQINSKSSGSTRMKKPKTVMRVVLEDLKNKNEPSPSSASKSENFRSLPAKCSPVSNSESVKKKKISDTTDMKNGTIIVTVTEADLRPKGFQDLPVEINEIILKKLRLTDLRVVRRVCGQWRDICDEILNYRTFHLGDRSSVNIEENLSKCGEIFVTYLTKTPFHDSTTFNGSTIRVLSFKNPNLETETVQWILRSCINLEEIRVDYFEFLPLYFHYYDHEKRFNEFLNSKLLKYIGLCQNLIQLDISFGRRENPRSPWRFNFEPLNRCPKLEYLNFRSRVPFYFYKRVNVIPTTVKKCNILMFLDEGPEKHTSNVIERMLDRIHPKIQPDVENYRISDSQKENELKEYLPSLKRCILKPHNKDEFKFLMSTLPAATRRLRCDQSSNITSIISISINQ